MILQPYAEKTGSTSKRTLLNASIAVTDATQPPTAHSRLTFAQAFNSLGTTIFPYVGAILILGSLAKVWWDGPAGLSASSSGVNAWQAFG